MGEDVETFWDGTGWRNQVVGRGVLPGEHPDRDSAITVGRDEARIRGVVHVIRSADGEHVERRRYPRLADEIPG